MQSDELIVRLRDDNSDYVYTERHEAADRIGEFDRTDPCSLEGCGKGNVIAFEDWRIGDAARLLWYAWPEEFLSTTTATRCASTMPPAAQAT